MYTGQHTDDSKTLPTLCSAFTFCLYVYVLATSLDEAYITVTLSRYYGPSYNSMVMTFGM